MQYSDPGTTATSLLERAKANDPGAWQRLCDLYLPLVYEWCRRAGVVQDAIPDVGQEIFLAVAGALGRFRHDREGDTFRGWLRAVTRSKVANWRQSQATRWAAAGGSHAQRRFQTLPAPDPPPGEELSEQGETQVLYARAVEIVSREFPEWYRPAFYRVVIGQERPQDVAADLKVRTSAVYNAKARILRRLREEFGDAFE